jgi:hypothetical protein
LANAFYAYTEHVKTHHNRRDRQQSRSDHDQVKALLSDLEPFSTLLLAIRKVFVHQGFPRLVAGMMEGDGDGPALSLAIHYKDIANRSRKSGQINDSEPQNLILQSFDDPIDLETVLENWDELFDRVSKSVLQIEASDYKDAAEKISALPQASNRDANSRVFLTNHVPGGNSMSYVDIEHRISKEMLENLL